MRSSTSSRRSSTTWLRNRAAALPPLLPRSIPRGAPLQLASSRRALGAGWRRARRRQRRRQGRADGRRARRLISDPDFLEAVAAYRGAQNEAAIGLLQAAKLRRAKTAKNRGRLGPRGRGRGRTAAREVATSG